MPAPVAWDCADEAYREHAYNCMAIEIQTLRSALVRIQTVLLPIDDAWHVPTAGRAREIALSALNAED